MFNLMFFKYLLLTNNVSFSISLTKSLYILHPWATASLNGRIWVLTNSNLFIVAKLLNSPKTCLVYIQIYNNIFDPEPECFIIFPDQHTLTMFLCTYPALLTPGRGWRCIWQRSSSRCADRRLWKHPGRWRSASHSRCSTSSGSIWWWCRTCAICWPPRMAASSRHMLLTFTG